MKFDKYEEDFMYQLMEDNLKPETAGRHMENLYIFFYGYLERKKARPERALIHIEEFLGTWYFKNIDSISEYGFNGMIRTLNKFYKMLLRQDKIQAKDYKEMQAMIKTKKSIWIDQIKGPYGFDKKYIRALKQLSKLDEHQGNLPIPVKDYRPLYKILADIQELEPWNVFIPDDSFAIKDRNGKLHIFTVLGSGGQEYALIMYDDVKAYYEAYNMMNGIHSTQTESTGKQSFWGFYFDHPSTLTPEHIGFASKGDKRFINSSSIPNVIKFTAGLPSEDFYNVEFKDILPTLREALKFLKHLVQHPQVVKTSRKSDKLIFREMFGNIAQDTYKDKLSFIDDHINLPDVPKSIDEITIKRSTKSCKRTNDVWEVDYLYYPDATEDRFGNVFYPIGLITINRKKQEVINLLGVKSPDDLVLFQESTLDVMSDLKIIPKKIQSYNPIALEYFKHLAKSLNIKLVLSDDLEQINAAKTYFYTEY